MRRIGILKRVQKAALIGKRLIKYNLKNRVDSFLATFAA
jgi:hypothetical protein